MTFIGTSFLKDSFDRTMPPENFAPNLIDGPPKPPKIESPDKPPLPTKPPQNKGDNTVAPLIKQLESGAQGDRINAAKQLAKMGKNGNSAIPALCNALLDSSDVRQAALEALEAIDPALYKHAVPLLIDRDIRNHVKASKALGEMGREAVPMVPALLAHLRGANKGRGCGEAAVADIEALLRIAPDNDAVIQLFGAIAAQPVQNRDDHLQVLSALDAINVIGGAYPAKRKDITTTLLRRLSRGEERDTEEYIVKALRILASLGGDAKEAVPAVKKLKLSSSMNIREAASATLEKIDR